MTQEALNRLGGTDYLVYLGKDQPAVFGALLRRCMPQAVETQSDDDVPVVTLNFAGDHKANVAKRVRKALEPAMINELSDDQLRTLYLEDELAERGVCFV